MCSYRAAAAAVGGVRSRRWLVLGLSAGRLLEYSSGSDIVRGLLQMFEEYEHWLGHEKEREKLNANRALVSVLPHLGVGIGGFVNLAAAGGISSALINTAAIAPSNASLLYSPPIQHSGIQSASDASADGAAESSAPIKASLQKVGKQVVYSVLTTPTFAAANSSVLDYNELVYSLCDVFSLVYSKFLDDSVLAAASPLHDAAIKVDKKIKSMIIAKLAADLTAVATPLLKLEMKGMLTHLFVDEARSTPQSRRYYQLDDPTTDATNKNAAQHANDAASGSAGATAADSDDEEDDD
jgi:hypothetical protein